MATGPMRFHGGLDLLLTPILRSRAHEYATLAALAADVSNARGRIAFVLEDDSLHWGQAGGWVRIPTSGGGAGNLPPGGSTAQVLVKTSAVDYAASWTVLGSPSLGTDCVTSAKIAAGAVVADKLGPGAVTAAAIGSGAVTQVKIASGAVGNTELQNDSVTSAKIASGAVLSGKLANGAVGPAALATDAVTAAAIADDAVSAAAIADDAVTAAAIADDAVSAAAIAPAAVTATKLANDAVSTAKIVDANVTALKLAPGAVTEPKLGAAAVTETKIADGAVTPAKQANVASEVIIGRQTAGSGPQEQLSPAQAKSVLGITYATAGLWSNTAEQTLSGVVSNVSMFPGSGIGNLTLPANFLTPGKVLRFRLSGVLTTDGSPGNATVRLRLGGTTIRTIGSFALAVSHADDPWTVEGELVCLTDGASGTVTADPLWREFLFISAGSIASNFWTLQAPSSAAAVTVDTTVAQLFDIDWSATDAATSITIHSANILASF